MTIMAEATATIIAGAADDEREPLAETVDSPADMAPTADTQVER